jgi:hypothetical protein
MNTTKTTDDTKVEEHRKDPSSTFFMNGFLYNRTGISTSPLQSRAMADVPDAIPPDPAPALTLHEGRVAAAQTADIQGTMPPPPTLRNAAATLIEALKGQKPAILVDLLGERLAFERTGVRLYQNLLVKLDAFGSFAGGPTRAELLSIQDDEARHAQLLTAAMVELGADPTALTPAANLAAIESQGVLMAINDSRMTLFEGLHSILVAELVDNDGWELLADVADRAGQIELAGSFRACHAQEEGHLAQVRQWLRAFIHPSEARESATAAIEEAAPTR